MVKAVNKVGYLLEKVSQVLCMFSLGTLIAITNIAVFFRYVLHSPLTWSNELAIYLLMSFTFWGATMGLLHDKFFCVDSIRELFPKRVQLILLSGSKVIISVFLIFAIFFTRPLVEQARMTKTLSPAMGIPMYLIYVLLMVGFLFMLSANLFSLLNSLSEVRENRQGREN